MIVGHCSLTQKSLLVDRLWCDLLIVQYALVFSLVFFSGPPCIRGTLSIRRMFTVSASDLTHSVSAQWCPRAQCRRILYVRLSITAAAARLQLSRWPKKLSAFRSLLRQAGVRASAGVTNTWFYHFAAHAEYYWTHCGPCSSYLGHVKRLWWWWYILRFFQALINEYCIVYWSWKS